MPTRTKHEPLKVAIIEAEITDFIQGLLEQKQPVQTDWVVHGILQRHQQITGDDAPWFLTHGYRSTRAMVRAVLRKFGLLTELPEDTQRVLPGWDHLQQYYPIKRNETSQIVPIEQMSNEELLVKAEEYRAMGRGCFEHAKELDKYREARVAAA